MIGALRPAGALLAALALWALGLVVLGALGLGGLSQLHPDDPGLTPAVPQVRLEAIGSRLGPASNYLEVGNRPLLSADRRPAPITSAGESNTDVPLEATLTSVLITGQLKLAIVQGKDDGLSRRVKLGEVLEGTAWRLVTLEPRRAVFEGPQGRRDLALRVFDGAGETAPTPATASAPARPRPATAQPAPAPAQASVPPEMPLMVRDPGEQAIPATPEQQVEAIRRRIEARRAMRAAEGAEERAALERAKQVK